MTSAKSSNFNQFYETAMFNTKMSSSVFDNGPYSHMPLEVVALFVEKL